MYLPSIGLTIAVTWAALRLATGSVASRWALGFSAILVVAALTTCAVVQTSYWRDDQTLWTRAVAVTENNQRARSSWPTVSASMASTNRRLKITSTRPGWDSISTCSTTSGWP